MFPINEVLQGDCTRVLRRLPHSFVDLVVTDPPYGVRYQDSRGRTIANDDDPNRILGAFTDLYRVLRPNSICVSFYGWGQVDAFFRAWRRAGFRPVGCRVLGRRLDACLSNRVSGSTAVVEYRMHCESLRELCLSEACAIVLSLTQVRCTPAESVGKEMLRLCRDASGDQSEPDVPVAAVHQVKDRVVLAMIPWGFRGLAHMLMFSRASGACFMWPRYGRGSIWCWRRRRCLRAPS
jgi:hypothetical protein